MMTSSPKPNFLILQGILPNFPQNLQIQGKNPQVNMNFNQIVSEGLQGIVY